MKEKSFLKKAKEKGYHTDHGLTVIGVALDNLSARQDSCLAIHSINKWLEVNFGCDFMAFYLENLPPSLNPNFPRFDIRDSIGFKGHLFSTSLETTVICEKAFQPKKYYYIQDIEWERPYCKVDTKVVESIKNNEEIIKVCRSIDHKKYIELQGWKIHPKIVEDFNVDQILEVINDRN